MLSCLAWRPALLFFSLSIPGHARGLGPSAARIQSLQVDLSVSEGPEVYAALRFRMEPGWHLYWKNPGDSGLPPEVAWDLPEGWKAGPLEHPVPLALASPGGLDYVHSGAFTFLAKLIPPSGKQPAGTVRARLDWLACKDACVQGKAVLSARVGDPATRLVPEALALARAQLPLGKNPGLQAGPASILRSADRWLIEIPLLGPEAARAGTFFPEVLPGFTIVYREVHTEKGVLRIPVMPSGPDARLDLLRGVLLLGGQGVALELPLPGAPAP
jgi:Disulphide bond corrector protein DsbC